LRRKRVAVDLLKRRTAVYSRGESVELWFAVIWSAWRADKNCIMSIMTFQGSSAESLFLPGHGLAQTM